jgi:hypothetical protein
VYYGHERAGARTQRDLSDVFVLDRRTGERRRHALPGDQRAGRLSPEDGLGPGSRDCGERASVTMIRTERSDHEPCGVDGRGPELEFCPGGDVPRQEPHHGGGLRLDPVEERVDAGHDVRDMIGVGQFYPKPCDVSVEHGGDVAFVGVRRIARRAEQFAHDLRIGLAVEPDAADGFRGREHPLHRAQDGPSPGTPRQEQRPVDIEQNQSHGFAGWRAAHSRHNVTPRKLQMRQMKVPQLVHG